MSERRTVEQVELVELVDGRVYCSDDNWQTVYLHRRLRTRLSRPVLVTGKQADRARFLAIAQSTSEGGRS